mmetsp:Transcript_23803/g.52068  ORF Transcript_23803/g.52068 Transcript_23803/m.52068 type:complete len:268 (+) Transcript_23803:1-804(+)
MHACMHASKGATSVGMTSGGASFATKPIGYACEPRSAPRLAKGRSGANANDSGPWERTLTLSSGSLLRQGKARQACLVYPPLSPMHSFASVVRTLLFLLFLTPVSPFSFLSLFAFLIQQVTCFRRLAGDHRSVYSATFLQQFFVTPLLQHSPLVDDADGVGIDHGRQPMGHHDHRCVALSDQIAQGTLDGFLRLFVQSRGCLVEQNNLGAPEKDPRNRQSLALSSRDSTPAFSDPSLVAILHFTDKIVGVCLLGSFHNFFEGVILLV